MFIELAEYLRCPGDHEETYLVVATGTMRGRDVISGVIGCPVCGEEFTITDGVAVVGEVPDEASLRRASPAMPPDHLQAMLDLASPGGYVVLVGSAADVAASLAERLDGVHFVAVNPAPDVEGGTTLSVLRSGRIPLRTGVARGVVVGGECGPSWIAEAARVVLGGRRIVVFREDVTAPEDVAALASGSGAWVGERTRVRRG